MSIAEDSVTSRTAASRTSCSDTVQYIVHIHSTALQHVQYCNDVVYVVVCTIKHVCMFYTLQHQFEYMQSIDQMRYARDHSTCSSHTVTTEHSTTVPQYHSTQYTVQVHHSTHASNIHARMYPCSTSPCHIHKHMW